jgi:ER-derived vesicles protein
MAQIRGTSGYNLGMNNFAQPNRTHDAMTSDPSPLDQIREQSSKIEDFLNTLAQPLKP